MTAQIRPNRMEVSDRFPMLGFAVRVDEPDVEAEVVLASDIALFSAENKARRTAANFYSSREHGTLMVPRGDGIFVVAPEVLARFIGSDKLHFGLATGKSGNGGLKVDALPREGSPYVSLRGFTGRTLRRSFGSGRQSTSPRLEWTGDATKPGSEGAAPSAVNGNGAKVANVAASAPYDDGFGPLPEVAQRPAAPPAVSQSLAVVRTLSDEPVAATPPSVSTLGTIARAALKVAILAAPPPFGTLFSVLIDAANALGCSVGFGPQVGAGLGVGGQLGVGVIFGKDGDLGVYGATEIDIGFITSISATANITIVQGGIDAFNGWNYALAISGGEGVVGGGAILLDTNSNFVGVSGNIGVGVGFSPIDFYVAAQRSWSTRVMALAQARAHGFAAEDAIGSAVMPQMPDDQRGRATRIGGEFAPRIGQALDLGLKPESLDPLLNLLDPPAMPQPLSYARSNGVGRAMNAPVWSIHWDDMDVVGQPTNVSCWATSASLLIGWRDRQSILPSHIASQCAMTINEGLSPAVVEKIASALGLYTAPAACYAPEGFRSLIEANGPLWVGKMMTAAGNSGHVVLVVGMYSDGTDHFLRVVDPWDRPVGTPGAPGNYGSSHSTGSRYIMRYEDFQAEYEMVAALSPTANVLILHTGGANGHQLNTSTTPPFGYAMSEQGPANGANALLPAPAPRARAMTGGAVEAAIAIGGIAIESIRDNVGDITWDLDQFRGIKHPNDSAPASPGAFQDGATIRLDDWPSTGPIIDSINAWFSIDWQFNGKSLGNVRINNIGTNDAIGAGLSVRAQIMDDNRLYPPSNCAALRITLHYRFSRPLGSDHIAIREIHLYGDGTWESDGRWVQSDMLGLVKTPTQPMGVKGDIAVELVGVIAGELISSSGTDISYALDRFENWKRPQGMPTDAPMGTIKRSTRTVEWDDGGWLDELGMKVDIEWQHDGTSLGHIIMTPYGFNDARGDSLVVTGKVLSDFEPYYGMMTNPDELAKYRRQPGARLRVQLHYRKSRWVRSDQVYVITVTLLPDGNSFSEGRWMDNTFF